MASFRAPNAEAVRGLAEASGDRVLPPATSPEGASPLAYRIRAEFLGMPDMALTSRQMQRLWQLDAARCDAVIENLVTSGFLRCRPDHRYVRAYDGRGPWRQ